MDELILHYNAEKMEVTILPVTSARLHNLVEVVRCKDCKYIAEAFDGSPCCKRLWRTAIPYVKEDDFCSYGERKDNEI